MKTGLLIIAVVGAICIVVSMRHWENTYQFGDFLIAFISVLVTLSVFTVYQYLLKAHPLIVWGFTLILIGGIGNTIVMAANGGFMPVPIITPREEYIPMEGAKLTWLADWIFRAISPGDVFLYLGFCLILFGVIFSFKRGVKK